MSLNAVDIILQEKLIQDENFDFTQTQNKTLNDILIKQKVFEEVIIERVKLI